MYCSIMDIFVNQKTLFFFATKLSNSLSNILSQTFFRCLEDFMVSPTPGTARYSMIMVGNSLAEYFYDQTTERLCVTLPYERPKRKLNLSGLPVALILSFLTHLYVLMQTSRALIYSIHSRADIWKHKFSPRAA